jgi:FAD:protein FMN transferase
VRVQRIKKITKTGPRASFLFACILFFSGLLGCTEKPEQLVFSGMTMGTTYQVKISPGVTAVPNNLDDQIDDRLQELDATFTTYQQTSELMKFNQSVINEAQTISLDMIEVIKIAHEAFLLTGGAFDPTVGPLVNLWGFGPDMAKDKVPAAQDIAPYLSSLGLNHLLLDEKTKTAVRETEIQLDLSAVAKGYAVDAVSDLLISQGFEHYLVEVGGELRAKGYKINGQPWRVAIEKPLLEQGGIQQVIELENNAVATSGDYRNYFEKEGKRYSHTIDPRSGYPITHNLASVTVVDSTAARADALATGMMVLGPEQALLVAEQNGIAVYLLVKFKEGFEVQYSSAFGHFISE